MTQEEKAKHYDEAIKRARMINNGEDVDIEASNSICEYIFPELKESEDERIMKELIDFIYDKTDTYELREKSNSWLAWLEKQGEQTNLPQFTFDDVLALQCCMETVKKVQEDKDLYKKLNDLHGRVYDAYRFEKQGEKKPLYIRFGDVPTNETSKIYRGEVEIGKENGVSVYPAFELNGNVVLGLTLPITKTTLYTQQHLLEYDNRPCYLVSGDYVGKGTDGEPLIRNISIIKRIDSYRVKEKKQGQKDPCKDCKHPMLNCMNFPCLKKQEYQGKTALEAIHEQKADNANKGERKYKVGDFIVNDYCKGKVIELTDDAYLLDTGQGIPFSCEHNAHLWTIRDAKDGDVLYSPCLSLLWIFKSIDTVYCGCNLNYNDGAFCGEGYIETPTDVIPATKEQRDFLFEKMKEAGYEWDAEKRELKLLVTNGGDFESKNCVQNNEWSEKYEERIKNILSVLNVQACWNGATGKKMNPYQKEIDWLKSLKDRYTWKPSDEQITALSDINLSGCISYAGQGQELINLYNDLKKL